MLPGEQVTLRVVHVLYHWNAHSFFTYHQDDDGHVTAIVNLSHGTASMHIAGKDTAEYDGIGATHIFPAKVFHRSGPAPRRCVKIAFFFDKAVPYDVGDDDDDDGDSPKGGKGKDKVKKEQASTSNEGAVKAEGETKTEPEKNEPETKVKTDSSESAASSS